MAVAELVIEGTTAPPEPPPPDPPPPEPPPLPAALKTMDVGMVPGTAMLATHPTSMDAPAATAPFHAAFTTT